jgi:hypothetical protein
MGCPGSVIVNIDPAPAWLWPVTVPPCSSTNAFTVLNPHYSQSQFFPIRVRPVDQLFGVGSFLVRSARTAPLPPKANRVFAWSG